MGITKRKHLPGFYVDFTKSKKKEQVVQKNAEFAERKKVGAVSSRKELLPQKAVAEVVIVSAEMPILDASLNSRKNRSDRTKNQTWWELNQFLRNPVTELRKERLNGDFKRAVFTSEEEKHGWSIISAVSLGLGAVGLALVVTGIALLVSFVTSAGFAFWWVFALIGILIGIAAMITGIIGLKQTGYGEKRGKGFALAGMIAGIVSMGAGLISLLWGLIYSIISGFGQDDF